MAQAKTIARPYAKAAFALAGSADEQQKWQQFFDAAAQFAETPQIMQHLHTPGFLTQLKAWLNSWLKDVRKEGLRDEEKNLLALLAEHGRIDILPELAQTFRELSSAGNDTCMVAVRTAEPLSDDEQAQLANTLEKKIGMKVVLNVEEAPELLAGVTITYDGKIIDQSLNGRLQQFARTLDD